jgi:hypothetical protein
LEDDLSEDDDAEQADDDGGVGECPERTHAFLERALGDATEASNLAIAGDVDERRSMLELSVPGVAVEPLPNSDVADPAEPPQVLDVTEILKRNHVAHSRKQRPPPWTTWWTC